MAYYKLHHYVKSLSATFMFPQIQMEPLEKMCGNMNAKMSVLQMCYQHAIILLYDDLEGIHLKPGNANCRCLVMWSLAVELNCRY